MNLPSKIFQPGVDRHMLFITAILSWCVLPWSLPNLGNNLIPRNFFVAAMLCLACVTCGSQVMASRHIRWMPVWGLLLVPPAVIALHAAWLPMGSFPHYPWLAGGILTLMACFTLGLSQLAWGRSQWTGISGVLLSGTTLLCLITLVSPPYLAWDSAWLALPLPLRATHGGFQQPNLLASFLATSIIFALWQQLRHHQPVKSWCAIGLLCLTMLHVFVVFKSGSRVGMLGLSMAMMTLGIWISICSPQNRPFGVLCLASLIAAALLAAWAGDVTDRLNDLAQGSSTSYRLSFIQASIHLWGQSPWWGHGLGTFSEKIVPVFVHMMEAGLPLRYTPNLGHPHNEVLLWAVETGAIGVLCILGPWVLVVGWHLRQLGWNGLAWLSSLFPISLHLLTEFPFHSSTAHIWLWCMVLVAGMPAPAARHWHWAASNWRPKVAISALMVLGLGAAWMLADTGWVSHQAWRNRPAFFGEGVTSLLPPAEREFHHPVLKTFANDQFKALNAPRLLSNQDPRPSASLCEDILEMGKRWQNPNQWAWENECLKLQGDEFAKLLHQRKVAALSKSP